MHGHAAASGDTATVPHPAVGATLAHVAAAKAIRRGRTVGALHYGRRATGLWSASGQGRQEGQQGQWSA